MGSGKISKKLLKKMGLSHLEKDLLKSSSLSERIEDGKNRHRSHLQQVKNDVLRQEIEKGLRPKEEHEFFNFRQNPPEYSSFRSLLSSKDWDNLELE